MRAKFDIKAHFSRRLKSLGVVASLSAIAISQAASAQDERASTSAQVDAYEGQEIVVTAQKRSESIQNVPISLTAFSGNMLESRQITSAADLVASVPNLQTNFPAGEGMPVFSLRGITMTDYSLNQAGPIAIYYDEVYKGNAAIQGLGFYDLERLEVLRGPQGTLYGKNTTGGAINFVARRPTFKNQGEVSMGIGNYNHYRVDGAIEVALNETLGARIAFAFDRADGWSRNAFPGAPDANSSRQYGIRATLRYKPNDAVDVVIRGSTSLRNPYIYPSVSTPTADGIGGVVYNAFGLPGSFREGLGKRDTNTPNITREHWRANALAVNANFKLDDDITLTSITSWDKGKIRFNEDSDGSPLDATFSRFDVRTKQITQDLRLSSVFDGPFDFILGGFFSKERIGYISSNSFYNDLDVNGDGGVDFQDCIDGGGFIACNFANRFTQTKTSYALYSDVTFQVSHQIKLRGGIRYTRDKGKTRGFTALLRGPDPDNVPLINLIPGSETDLFASASQDKVVNNVSFKVGVDFKPSARVLLYANLSQGFRGAGFNGAATFGPDELSIAKPEKLTSAELGFKAELFDRLLRFNGAVFWYSYKNQQIVDTDPATSVSTLINIPKSRILGAEFDMQIRPTRNLTISTGAGFLDSKILRGTSLGIDVRGNNLINAPAVTFTSSIDWAILLPGFVADANADFAYSSKQNYDILNRLTTTEGSYAIVNTRVRFHPEEDSYGLALWVKNLTNTFYHTNRIDVSGVGFIYGHVNPPRTYGITIDAKF